MSLEVPALLPTLVISDDAYLSAELSCALSKRNSYLAIIEAPRMKRPDSEAEVLRCNNAAARMQPSTILFAGVEQSTILAFRNHFPATRTLALASLGYLADLDLQHRRRTDGPLVWGRKRVGIGLLRALRERRQIVFDDTVEASDHSVASESGHLVVCEEGNPFAEVIAANYAFALGAGFTVIPSVAEETADRILEVFYSVYDNRSTAPTEALLALKRELIELSDGIDLAGFRSATFITRALPWGFAFTSCPTTHLFSYPHLGMSILSGVLAEQPKAPGIRVALLIDKDDPPSQDGSLAIQAFKGRDVFVRGLLGKHATVYRVGRTLELFPYDFLLISTHCGDAPGWRWTYEFTDRDGRDRTLVVDITIAVAQVPSEEKLEVLQFTRFVSLDGVDWHDPEKQSKLVVGNAIHDYLKRTGEPEPMMPSKRETIPRVIGSAALQVANGNYIPMPVSLADEGTPIVLNNACVSWHRLASNFVHGNARAYIGTLFPVTEIEAHEIADKLLNRHFGKPLAVALWHAQNELFGDAIRRPYVIVGAHFQGLRTTRLDAPAYIVERLRKSLQSWLRKTAGPSQLSDAQLRTIKDYQRFLAAELKHFRSRWLN